MIDDLLKKKLTCPISAAIKAEREAEEKRIAELEADAARWRYVRYNLARMSVRRGRPVWQFCNLLFAGDSLDEAIDKLREQNK